MIGFSVPRKLEQGMERTYAVTVDNIECAYFDQVEKLSGFGSRNRESIAQLEAYSANWSCAIGYGLGSGSPLSPSFNFGLELAKSLQVKNPLEENEVVGITNYIDFGFELQTRVDDKPSNVTPDSTFQFAVSWQANKNFLLKGKVGPFSSSVAFALKSWWKPAFTFQHFSYQRADPNFVMLTPNKEHLADGIQWKIGNRPVLQSDINSGNFDGIPRELRPLGRIL